MSEKYYAEQFKSLTEMSAHMKMPKEKCMRAARERLDAIAKPLDGLGLFEEMIVRMAGMQESAEVETAPARLLIMCADNGIVEEGVTQSDASVTAAVAGSLARGTSSVCRMAQTAGIDHLTVDIGVRDAITGSREKENIRDCRIRNGTRNFSKEPAMTAEETVRAIQTGADLVKESVGSGYRIVLTGEMGIGNTTTSAAMAAVLTGAAVDVVTGRGAGLDAAGLERKRNVIRESLDRYGFAPGNGDVTDRDEVFRLLCCVGGYDIAGMAGIYLGGALYGVPIVIDGVISAVAALTAERIFPGCRRYMLPSHQGKEPAMALLLEALHLKAPIHAELALGEGTGAVMLLPLLRMALAVYRGNTGFDALGMDAYERYDAV
ncbi:MAG: nicotinate-nucleotide--dimethylbenzimidazole phosphoribosyltransferase [Lachnospiraceae bacterium]|nr:nicotinate-nucleotide--dimethylbenzimidazole phosphoribosyltransferase [Lachnospiraceae bacterium]